MTYFTQIFFGKRDDYSLFIVLQSDCSDTSANEDNSFRNHIR